MEIVQRLRTALHEAETRLEETETRLEEIRAIHEAAENHRGLHKQRIRAAKELADAQPAGEGMQLVAAKWKALDEGVFEMV